MHTILIYLCKLSISLSVVYLFYQLVLRPLTFYQWNRWYLLLYTALCFYIPFIDLMPVLDKSQSAFGSVVYLIPNMNSIMFEASWFESLEYWDYLMLIFGMGILIFIIKFLLQIFSLYRLKKKAILIHNESVKMYDVSFDGLPPFSFGKNIFLNTEMHSAEDLEKIIAHEFVHVQQKHSIDMLWVELLCIIQWYNPFVWMIKRSVKQNLEFIADQSIVNTGLNKKEYQYLLLKVIGNSQFSITNNFNIQSLKNRIKMMNKLRSTKIHLTKFLFMLPVVALLLLSFRNQIKEAVLTSNKEVLFNEQQDYQNTILENSIAESNKSLKNEAPKAFVIKDTVPKSGGRIVIKSDTLILRGGAVNISQAPLFIIDGKSFSNKNAISNIDPNNIESIEVLKEKSAIELYGEKGKSGVIVINLKHSTGVDALVEKVIVDRSKSINNDLREVEVVVRHPKSDELKEVRIDGVKYDNGSIKEVIVTGHPKSNARIKEVRVDGVKYEKDRNSISVEEHSGSYKSEGKKGSTLRGLSINTLSVGNFNGALFIVDGQPMIQSKVDKINPETIKEIEVLKGEAAKKYYGDKGKNGVVVITTKK